MVWAKAHFSGARVPGEVLSVNQINVVAAAIFAMIATAFAYMFDFYPLWVAIAGVGLIGYVAFMPTGGSKKAPPSEPWYMK
jgi:hypothetical protein